MSNNTKKVFTPNGLFGSYVERDHMGRETYERFQCGLQCWWSYDDVDGTVHMRNSDGFEGWYMCDENGDIIMEWNNRDE